MAVVLAILQDRSIKIKRLRKLSELIWRVGIRTTFADSQLSPHPRPLSIVHILTESIKQILELGTKQCVHLTAWCQCGGNLGFKGKRSPGETGQVYALVVGKAALQSATTCNHGCVVGISRPLQSLRWTGPLEKVAPPSRLTRLFASQWPDSGPDWGRSWVPDRPTVHITGKHSHGYCHVDTGLLFFRLWHSESFIVSVYPAFPRPLLFM